MSAAVCSHGERGYCHDDALPESREAAEFTHHAAYAWALESAPTSLSRNDAEAFATWVVDDNARGADFVLPFHLGREWERYAAQA